MSLVVVFGATGQQGGGVVDTLLKDSKWKVRAVTRNTDGKNAKALAAQGVEVVAADLNKEETVANALKGAYAAFLVTSYWESAFTIGRIAAGEEELEQVKAVARAASSTPTLKHFVFSSLPPAEKISKGKHAVPHLDYKGKAVDWIEENTPDLAKKTTITWPGWYGNNVVNFPMFKPLPYPGIGGYLLAQPAKRDSILPVVGEISRDTGLVVEAILNSGEKTFGKIVPIITEFIPIEEVAHIFTRVTGKGCAYGELTDQGAKSAWGDLFGVELTAQLRWSEDHPDWYSFFPGKTLSLKDIGVDESKLVKLEPYLKSVADQIV